VRTARPELVRRALLLLEGSPAVLDISDAFRMAAAEGGIVGGGGGGGDIRWLGLGECRGGRVSVKSTLA
jgi:hypothetical protein